MAKENPIPATPYVAGPGDWVKSAYDNLRNLTAGKIWRGIQHVAGSGMGKGLLIAAAMIIGGSLIYGATAIGSEVALEHGLSYGIGLAARILTSGPGLLALTGSAVLGAVAMPSHHNQLSLAQAKRLEKQYEEARQTAQGKATEVAIEKKSTPSMVAQILKRRQEGREEGLGR